MRGMSGPAGGHRGQWRRVPKLRRSTLRAAGRPRTRQCGCRACPIWPFRLPEIRPNPDFTAVGAIRPRQDPGLD